MSNNVYGELSIAGDTITGSPTDILTTVQAALEDHDPDVLVCSTSEIVPTLEEMATVAGVDDNEKTSRERVALAHEEIKSYDPSYYETELVRAVESVLSPLGWDQSKIRRELTEMQLSSLSTFTERA